MVPNCLGFALNWEEPTVAAWWVTQLAPVGHPNGEKIVEIWKISKLKYWGPNFLKLRYFAIW